MQTKLTSQTEPFVKISAILKRKILACMLSAVLILVMMPIQANAATRESVKASGDYKAGSSVYGPKLSAAQLNEVADVVADFVNQYIDPEMPWHQKADIAAYYIGVTCTYAPDWSKNGANTAWGSLIYGEAQCSGYARGFKALCDGMGVPCYYVHSSQTSHQWNMVQLENGDWRHIDPQLYSSTGGGSMPIISALYFSDDESFESFGYEWDKSAFPACTYSGKPLSPNVCRVTQADITVLVDGRKVVADSYNVNGYNYFKLRDIAMAVTGTNSQFNVTWNESKQSVVLDKGMSYVTVGGEMVIPPTPARIAYQTFAKLYNGNQEITNIEPINVNGNNYFRLRDIGDLCGFAVNWDEAVHTIQITT